MITKDMIEQMISERKEFVVHCDTEAASREFLDYLGSMGVCWCSGRKITGIKEEIDRTSFRLNSDGVLSKGHRDLYEDNFKYLPNFEWADILSNSIKVTFDEDEFYKMLGVYHG